MKYYLLLANLFFIASTFGQNIKVTKNIHEGKLYENTAGIAIYIHHLEDSLIKETYYFDKDSIPLKYRTKTIFEYDEQKRLIGSIDYVDQRRMKWEFGQRAIAYFNDSIVVSFPNARTISEGDDIGKMFEKASKIIFLLNSKNQIITKKYSNQNNQMVPILEMQITHEKFTYDKSNRLIRSEAFMSNNIWSNDFQYNSSSRVPTTNKEKMLSTSKEFDSEIEFVYNDSNEYKTRDLKESTKWSDWLEYADQIIAVRSQFHAEYWDNSRDIPQINLEFEMTYIWLNH